MAHETTGDPLVANHHSHYGTFSGLHGLVAALSMVGGRTDNARIAADLCSVGAGDLVVDIGCGPGAAARYAARLGATVTGIDPAPVMRRVGRALTRSHKVRYLDGAAEALPLDDGCATVVWSIATVHHWRDVDASLAEVRRVLRPGGRFLAMERERDGDAQGLASHGWTPEQAELFAHQCAAHGFIDVQRNTHPTTHKHKPATALTVLATAP